ncbi:hypothetical protein BST27_26320 [Mycobacterium intermedium]|uniref:Uncharacterized protein n=1 Tax=Mycobacterium intermedium TaxID=28445 RepID=A0A1E3SHF4_MYCIE|nr:hypothetical protein [Mycobacterium intermedium]MCV6963286.1 hypothetical protein [Mycobacterium intermedium]ODR01502.1 hypothetical protein BHQ20_08410 [Mycobacterium intermedium]OPE47441.1 hypothetical protein BV508_21955 [Mycobacterium intermedium]ORA95969.1 hypothetical protein BST27_26320 [Mycobacterium intermedium]
MARTGLVYGLLTSGIGLAHFAAPALFEPVNRTLGFKNHTRRHVYINGAIATLIGLSMMHPRTRTLTPAAGTGYSAYLLANYMRGKSTGVGHGLD